MAMKILVVIFTSSLYTVPWIKNFLYLQSRIVMNILVAMFTSNFKECGRSRVHDMQYYSIGYKEVIVFQRMVSDWNKLLAHYMLAVLLCLQLDGQITQLNKLCSQYANGFFVHKPYGACCFELHILAVQMKHRCSWGEQCSNFR